MSPGPVLLEPDPNLSVPDHQHRVPDQFTGSRTSTLESRTPSEFARPNSASSRDLATRTVAIRTT